MDRNNGRFTYVRRQGQQHQQHQHQHQHQQQQQQQQQQHQSSSSLSSSSSSSLSSTSNNNQHLDNHRNSSASSASSQFSSSTTTSAYSSQSAMSREPLTQHDELIRYIREAWTKVSEQGPPVISCKESDHQLKNFKPFNLEEYWGQRLVQNIHVSHGHQ